MIANDCKYCIMEVSSHALVLNPEVDCIDYKIGVFTNLTPRSFRFFIKILENYKNAKRDYFIKTNSVNIFNIDDE